MIIHTAEVKTPVGTITFYAAGDALCAVAFKGEAARTARSLTERFGEVTFRRAPDPAGAVSRMRAYLAGEITAFDSIPVEIGGTPFQRAVWEALRRIPAGSTISYAQLAAKVGRPKAVRAAGSANGKNPVGIVIPCHRVIAADGTIGGYGGGLAMKHWLLRHEGVEIAKPSARTPRRRVKTSPAKPATRRAGRAKQGSIARAARV
jgi:methylated-DNA-[protein]-cysteine S-methyltransferase